MGEIILSNPWESNVCHFRKITHIYLLWIDDPNMLKKLVKVKIFTWSELNNGLLFMTKTYLLNDSNVKIYHLRFKEKIKILVIFLRKCPSSNYLVRPVYLIWYILSVSWKNKKNNLKDRIKFSPFEVGQLTCKIKV